MVERTRIVAIGNRDRGDDGLGPLVADRLKEAVNGRAEVLVSDGDPGDLLEAMTGCDRLILIDACAPAGTPGRVSRETDRARLMSMRPSSSHVLGAAEVLGLAEVLDRLPAEVVVYAMEGLDFEPGAPLSDAAEAGVDIAVGMILEEVADA